MGPNRLERGISNLEALGLRVRVGAQAFATGTVGAGSADARAEELNGFLRDPYVRGIICTIGGLNSNGILRTLDYEAFARDPKVVVGYSDLTNVLLALYARTNVVVYHGPTLLPEIAEFPTPLPYTMSSLMNAVFRDDELQSLAAASEWTDEFLLWDSEDVRPREMHAHPGWSWSGSGSAEGPLLGGNLDSLTFLVGTPYVPDFDGALLFWETMSTSLSEIDRALTHLDDAGLTAHIGGMIVGRPFRAQDGFDVQLRDYVRARYGAVMPILMGADIGHADPMLTLPIGGLGRLDADSREFRVGTPS